mmetsp:Transcript_29364/g.68239  ORF Transcript_29364/g.68239 Transcript_29364/m.68239 type:complete len:305 (+) Transcript_29364:1-915(+)
MLWMDGKGSDGQGPCVVDAQRCGDNAKFYNFKVEELPGMVPSVQPLPGPGGGGKKCSPWGKDCRDSLCCLDDTSTCYEKNQWWASCKTRCVPGIDPFDPPGSRQPWTCKPLNEPRKQPPPPKPPATKIVVLRVPVRDIWPGLAHGSKVTLAVGEDRVKAEVVRVSRTPKAPPPGGFNSTTFWVTMVMVALVLLAVIGFFVHRSRLREQDIMAMTERAVQVSREMSRSAQESFRSWTQGHNERPSSPPPRAPAEPPRSFMQSVTTWFQQQAGTTGASGSADAAADSRPPHRPMRRVEQSQSHFLW